MTEKIIIVGVETYDNQESFTESMEELTTLVNTADGEVVYSLIQKRDRIDSKTVIGKGKLEELVQLVDAYEANGVVFNQELTPRQGQLIEAAVNIKVIDRVQLILDIFALRAQSKEGKMQVELAQLSYQLPRLSGQGTSLSRLGAGIGTRGPGETKLETDRRHIRDRMAIIRRDLKDVAAHRERHRTQRRESNVFRIGLIGYTNAGKSTLLNNLTDAEAYSANQLFATLDPLTKRWNLDEGMEITITDTVGFMQDLPTQLIESFQSTIEESRDVDLLLHVIDASSPYRLLQEKTVTDLLTNLKMDSIPILAVYNKMDLVEKETFVPTLFPYCMISAQSDSTSEIIQQAVKQEIEKNYQHYEFTLAPSEVHLLNKLREETLLLSDEFNETDGTTNVTGYARPESKWIRRSIDGLDD